MVIKISEEDYKRGTVMASAIRNGIPLLRGHGDLIDRKELLKQPIDIVNYPSNYVKIAHIIIEADKETKDV